MKKVLALLLAVVMVIGMSTMAMAEDGQATGNTITFKVKYTQEGDGTAPAQTFTFTTPVIEDVDATKTGLDANGQAVTKTHAGIPTFAETDIALDAFSGAGEKTATITLPDASEFPAVGVYIYKFAEKAGTTAGVEYDTKNIYLVITVNRDETNNHLVYGAIHCEGSYNPGEYGVDPKTDEIENKYNNGNLSVKKTVTGNMGDTNKPFNFTVVFAAPTGKTIADGNITTTAGKTVTWDGNTAIFTLKHDETLSFSNVPEGVTYTVVEDDYTSEGYTTSGEVETATAINVDTDDAVTVTNNKERTVDTGIVLDSLPYILIGVAVAAAAVLMVAKKRRIED